MDISYDVSLLMTGILNDIGNDTFGRDDAGPRRALLLDVVMEGHPRTSPSLLLSLPSEILACIVDLLADSKATLASMALVNSDCRQLARSAQFADIHFDYSAAANQLISVLGEEASARSGGPPKPTIGACARKVTVAPVPENVTSWHRELWESIWGPNAKSYSQAQRYELRRAASDVYVSMRHLLVNAISQAMPNLEVLVWKDTVPLDRTFFEKISRSSIQHLKLDRVWLDEPWRMEPPLTPAVWPLRSLDIEANAVFGEGMRPDTTQFTQTLLHLCAPTLESLRIVSLIPRRPTQEDTYSQTLDLPSFPRLRHLRLAHAFLSRELFSSLSHSPLRSLELSVTSSSNLGRCLGACQQFRDLESLDVFGLPEDRGDALSVALFLRKHNHIQKLRVREKDQARGLTAHLERYIIPTLTMAGFHNLRCLSLVWGGATPRQGFFTCGGIEISESALSAVGTITSLERLSLSAGISIGWRHQWVVDHEKVRRCLKSLTRLTMLAFVRDTYEVSCIPNFDVETYYVEKIPEPGEFANRHGRFPSEHLELIERYLSPTKQTWERFHQDKMLSYAEDYAMVFPALEWMFCGQWPIGFKENPKSWATPKRPFPLTLARDSCHSFLERTFGLATSERS